MDGCQVQCAELHARPPAADVGLVGRNRACHRAGIGGSGHARARRALGTTFPGCPRPVASRAGSRGGTGAVAVTRRPGQRRRISFQGWSPMAGETCPAPPRPSARDVADDPASGLGTREAVKTAACDLHYVPKPRAARRPSGVRAGNRTLGLAAAGTCAIRSHGPDSPPAFEAGGPLRRAIVVDGRGPGGRRGHLVREAAGRCGKSSPSHGKRTGVAIVSRRAFLAEELRGGAGSTPTAVWSGPDHSAVWALGGARPRRVPLFFLGVIQGRTDREWRSGGGG